MMSCTNLKESLDIYGSPLTFSVNNKFSIRTIQGISSLAVAAFILFYIIDMTQRLTSGELPYVVTQNKYLLDPEKFQFNDQEIFFFLGFMNQNDEPIPINPQQLVYVPIFDVYQRAKGTSDFVTTSIPLQRCSASLLSENLRDVFLRLIKIIPENHLAFTYCLSKQTVQQHIDKLALQGSIGSDEMLLFAINVYDCKELNSQQLKCHKDSTKIIESGYAALFVPDQMIDEKNLQNPFSLIKREFLINYFARENKQITIKYQHVLIETFMDFFYLGGQKQTDHKLAFSSIESSIQSIRKKNSEFLNIILKLDTNQKNLQRRYGNILDVVAKALALLRLFDVIVRIILRPFTNCRKKQTFDEFLGVVNDSKKEQLCKQLEPNQFTDLIFIQMQITQIHSLLSQLEVHDQSKFRDTQQNGDKTLMNPFIIYNKLLYDHPDDGHKIEPEG